MPTTLPQNGRGPALAGASPREQCRAPSSTDRSSCEGTFSPFGDPEALVVLTSVGPRLAKAHSRQPDGSTSTEAYDDAKYFRARAARVPSLSTLASVLNPLADDRGSAVVRADVRQDTDHHHLRRRLHDSGDEQASLREVPRNWVGLDFDGLDAPEGWWLDLPRSYDQVVRPVLPVDFRRVGCVVQATGSAGIKLGLRLRVWFLLTTALWGAELRRVFADVPGLDRSTTYPATLIYTARPVFIGMDDPVPVRTVVVPGKVERVAVHVPPEPPAPPSALLRPPIDGSWGPRPAYSRAALDRACGRIVQAGEKEQHPTLFREAAGIGGLVGSGHMPASLARDMLIAAGLAMTNFGRPWRREEIARQIDRGLAAGMEHPRVPGER